MVDVAINVTGKLISVILEMKKQKAELHLEIQKILILATGIQKGLYFYQNLTMMGDDQSIKNLTNSLEDTHTLIVKIKKRNCLSSYLMSKGDFKQLQDSYSLVSIAFEAIEKTAQLATSGQKIKSVQGNTALNKKVFEVLKSKSSQTFWQEFVVQQKLPLPVIECGEYFKSFVAQYNQTEQGKKDKLKLTYLEPVIAKIIDKNHTGYVELEEIEKYFTEWWENEDKRKELKKKLDINIGETNDKFLFVYQILRLVNCQKYFPLFKFNGIDGKHFLLMDLEKLKICFKKQISEIELVKISNCIQEIQEDMKQFNKIKEDCIKMRLEVDNIVKETLKLKNENKLSKQKLESDFITEAYFEFKNGCGHTYLVDDEGSVYIGMCLDFKPQTSFYIQYAGEGHEANYSRLTNNFSDYYGLYYIINQNPAKPFQIYSYHQGNEEMNNNFMKAFREDINGKSMGYNIIDNKITAFEIPDGRQIYIDNAGQYMIRYFVKGVEVSYEDFNLYQDQQLIMESEKAKQLIEEQGFFRVEQIEEESEDDLNEKKVFIKK